MVKAARKSNEIPDEQVPDDVWLPRFEGGKLINHGDRVRCFGLQKKKAYGHVFDVCAIEKIVLVKLDEDWNNDRIIEISPKNLKPSKAKVWLSFKSEEVWDRNRRQPRRPFMAERESDDELNYLDDT